MTARGWAAGAIVLGVLLGGAGILGLAQHSGAHATPTPSWGTVPSNTGLMPPNSESVAPLTASQHEPAASDPVGVPGAGSHLTLPAEHVTAPLDVVGDQNRVLEVPRDPTRVGWWSGSAPPGSTHGATIVVGHVNYAGTEGAFARLIGAAPGDPVVITEAHHQFRYTVQAVRSYAKTTGLPADLTDTQSANRLVLITCGGTFDAAHRNYEDNVVVYATAS